MASPENSVRVALSGIGRKAAVGDVQELKEVAAPAPGSSIPEDRQLRAFDFEDVTPTPKVPGIDGAIVGKYVIKVWPEKPLATTLPGGGVGAVDPANLHDIVLLIAYGLAI